MANYTISTNARQEQILTWVVAKVNAERILKGLPPFTNQEYINFILGNVLKDYVKQYWSEEGNKVKGAVDEKWDDITGAQRNQIKTILGVT